MSTPTRKTIRDLDVSAAVVEASIAAGRAAEARHLCGPEPDYSREHWAHDHPDALHTAAIEKRTAALRAIDSAFIATNGPVRGWSADTTEAYRKALRTELKRWHPKEAAGQADEQRHQYRDLDTDSTCRPDGFVCVNCPPKGVDCDG